MSLFRKRPEVPTELASARAELEKLVRDYRDLETAARSLGNVLDAMFLPESPPAPVPDAARHQYQIAWNDRRPAFSASPPVLDAATLRRRGLAITKVLLAQSEPASRFTSALKRGRIDLERWASLWFSGDPARPILEAEELGIDAESAVSIFRFALMPSLAPITVGIEAPENWRSSSCPYCDGEAVLGELRGLEGGRFLRCGLCASDWGVDRLGCPGCGEMDHRHLKSLAVEGEVDRRRLFLCESCGLRLKVVQTLARLSPPSLVVAELATVHLNFL